MDTLLLVHNYYQQPGGEDAIFATEAKLLEERGHRVVRYTVHNNQIDEMTSIGVAKATLWNSATYKELREVMRRERPGVVHFHNTFPLISPAAYYAAQAEGVPVVQTINNYRLACPGAYFLREGKVCEDCLGKSVPLPGVVHGCYRDSRLASGVVAAMLTTHKVANTWRKAVDVYALYLTEFAREKFILAGLPAEKLVIKPNFVHPDPLPGEGGGGYALFVGRLSPEKGVITMLNAWKKTKPAVGLKLKIAGDGPLASTVEKAAEGTPGIEWVGRKSPEEVYALMRKADFLVFPSEWYEGLPRTIVEAFAAGTPIVASNLGAMSSLIDHQRTGLHFQPSSADDLAAKVKWMIDHPKELAWMRREARSEYEAHYTADRNYEMLMELYDKAHRNAAQAGKLTERGGPAKTQRHASEVDAQPLNEAF